MDWLKDVGGRLDFSDIKIQPRNMPELPIFIPEVDGGKMQEYEQEVNHPVYAVNIRRVLNKNTAKILPSWEGRNVREVLGLSPDKKVVLFMFGYDEMIEKIWTCQYKHNLWEEIAKMNFDVVAAPNYSIYGEHPRFEHLLNIRRNLLVTARMREAGINAIPNIYWWTEKDFDRNVEWIKHSGIEMIAVNTQTCRTAEDWEFIVNGLRRTAEQVGDKVTVLINGLANPTRIKTAKEILPKVIFASRNVQVRAWNGRRFGPKEKDKVEGISQAQLFKENIQTYLRCIGEYNVLTK